MKRKMIEIDRELCNGCGECVIGCPEGALQVIDGKAAVVNERFCDGLGACIGDCPLGALRIVEKEAEEYSEREVAARMAEMGGNVLQAHMKHLKDHGESELLKEAEAYLKEKGIAYQSGEAVPFTCPGTAMKTIEAPVAAHASELTQWPVQMSLINPSAPYFQNADLLISADCVPYAVHDFHSRYLKGKKVITFCPKLDGSTAEYVDKLTELFKRNDIRTVSVLRMEVPCCGGTTMIVQEALKRAGKVSPLRGYVIATDGKIR